jgi:uncharacterized protein YcfL
MRLSTLILVLCALALGCSHMTGDKHEEKEHDAKTVKIDQSQLPANVMTAFQKDHPNVQLQKVKKETYADGTIHYELEWKDAAGKEHEAEYNDAGEELEKH